MSFDFSQRAGLEYLHCSQLTQRGYQHGFGCNWQGSQASTLAAFQSAFDVKRIFAPRQVHGSDVLRVPFHDASSADAVIAERSLVGNAVLIRTADCVPIIFVGQKSVALVHAGWRGIVAGVIEAVLRQDDVFTYALIGPCAGVCCYEVGAELISALAPTSHFREAATPGKFMLNLEKIVIERITRVSTNIEIEAAQICTICDRRFASYRRDGTTARNFSFVVL
ncbi:MAG: polyphenol oxidase family protein [Oligoflexia bacterium]|nr:polyphenol oxidase family protein [Oligoflexia bacterium]